MNTTRSIARQSETIAYAISFFFFLKAGTGTLLSMGVWLLPCRHLRHHQRYTISNRYGTSSDQLRIWRPEDVVARDDEATGVYAAGVSSAVCFVGDGSAHR